MTELVHIPATDLALLRSAQEFVPAIIQRSDPHTLQKFLEFFAASIRNVNTRAAYATATRKFFAWCDANGITELEKVQKLHVSAYIEMLTREQSAPTVKQNLAALRMLFEYLRVPRDNPAEGVRGPKHVVRVGRTPVLTAAQAGELLKSIETDTLIGLRDRALISLMIYSFGRISAVVGMDVDDYYLEDDCRWIRLREKGGKEHTVPVHDAARKSVDAYIVAASPTTGPLFRTIQSAAGLSEVRLSRFAAWEMVKRRARVAGMSGGITNHSFRATGITVYLENGGTIENARNIAAHASIKTTQTYDRRSDRITEREIGKIRL